MEHTVKGLVNEAAEELPRLFADWDQPVAFVQTGSGLCTDELFDEVLGESPMCRLRGMPDTLSPAGHELTLRLGLCGGKQVLLAQGRRHLYEGHGTVPCVLPACAAVKAGISTVILACAAGAVNPEFRPGTVVALTDYINNLGTSPLVGAEPLGDSYFLAMNEAYAQGLVSEFINCVPVGELHTRLGVYQANLGPQYETPAEIEAAMRNGADLVGMSMVPATIAARALGAQVLGLAVVTNVAASKSRKAPTHEEVTQVAGDISPVLMHTLNRFLGTWC